MTGGPGADRFSLYTVSGSVRFVAENSVTAAAAPSRITDFNAAEGDFFFTAITGGTYNSVPIVLRGAVAGGFLANVGDTRSLILHPASTTHRQLSDDERIAAGAGPDVIRLSVGIETVEDLIADLDRALGAAAASGDTG